MSIALAVSANFNIGNGELVRVNERRVRRIFRVWPQPGRYQLDLDCPCSLPVLNVRIINMPGELERTNKIGFNSSLRDDGRLWRTLNEMEVPKFI